MPLLKLSISETMKKFMIMIMFGVLSTFSAGCEQSEGERCEADDNSDCESSYICCIPIGETEGTCQTEENCQK
jgi:hypothetical protein